MQSGPWLAWRPRRRRVPAGTGRGALQDGVRTLSGSIGGGARAGGGVSVRPRRVGRRPAAGTQISARCSTMRGKEWKGKLP
jgi:hypothetical protein